MIELSAELRTSLANSMTDRIAVIAAYVDRNGDPHVGFYGSLHAYSDDQLALWARKPDSELVATLPDHPKIEFVYSDMVNARIYRLGGSARIVTDAVERDRIYDGIHEIEREPRPGPHGCRDRRRSRPRQRTRFERALHDATRRLIDRVARCLGDHGFGSPRIRRRLPPRMAALSCGGMSFVAR